MPRTTIARKQTDIERLRSLWESLYRPGGHTLFQSFEWNRLAARAFGQREPPHVIAVEDEGGAAILPACLARGGLCLLGEELFDYRDVLSAGDGGALALAWKSAAELGRSLAVTALSGQRTVERWQDFGFFPEPFVNAPQVLRRDVDAETFAHQHRSARRLRRLARAGVTCGVHPGTNSALVREIYERKAGQALTTGENLFADPLRRDFLTAAAASGACEIFTLESAGTLVAALVTFRDHQVRRFYTTYYDHAWASYSPGVALLFEATRRSLADGFDCDYMTGEQQHKIGFATSAVPLFRVYASADQLAELAGRPLVAA